MENLTKSQQKCHVGSDGFMYCNFVIRKNGAIIMPFGKRLRFPILSKLKRKLKPSSEWNQKEGFNSN